MSENIDSEERKRLKRVIKELPLDCLGNILRFFSEIGSYRSMIWSFGGFYAYIKNCDRNASSNIRFPLIDFPDRPLYHVMIIRNVAVKLVQKKYYGVCEICRKLSSLFPELRELDLNYFPKYDAILPRICRIENLQMEFPRLKKMKITLSDESLAICDDSLKNVESLVLKSRTQHSNGIVQRLSIDSSDLLPSLTYLEIDTFEIQVDTLKMLKIVPKDITLRNVKRWRIVDFDDFFEHIKTKIRKLNFHDMFVAFEMYNRADPVNMTFLRDFPVLEELVCVCDHFEQNSALVNDDDEESKYNHHHSTFMIHDCPKLRRICVRGYLTCFRIFNTPMIEDLDFGYCGHIQMESYKDAHHMRRLRVQNCCIGKGLWNNIGMMKNLEVISVYDHVWMKNVLYSSSNRNFRKPLDLYRLLDLRFLSVRSGGGNLLVKRISHCPKLSSQDVKWVGGKVMIFP